MGGDFEILKAKLRQGLITSNQVRFFVGYSGWSPKQLDNELKLKSWFVTSVKPDVLMNTTVSDLWKVVMRGLGKKGEIISNLPDDPSLN